MGTTLKRLTLGSYTLYVLSHIFLLKNITVYFSGVIMYQLLQPKPDGQNNRVTLQNLSAHRSVMLRELHKVISHYHRRPRLTDPQHILVRIINLLTISFKRSQYSIVDACMERTEVVARQLDLAHPLNSNAVTKTGEFYNNKVEEVIVLNDSDEPDYDNIKAHWQTISAIRILTHPFADIDMNLCDGRYPTSVSEGGYAVIVIDTPILMLQYRHWVEKGLQGGINMDSLDPRYFVSQICIPNLLIEHMDICFINRAIRIYKGEPVPMRVKVHPTQVLDYSPRVDDLIEQQVDILKEYRINAGDVLTLFPAVLKSDWYSSIKIPTIPPNINTRWVLELAALPYLTFILLVYADRNPAFIRPLRNTIKRDARALGNNKEVRHLLQTPLKNVLDNLDVR